MGALAKGCAATRSSFVAFGAAQIAIDVESGYFLFHGGWPLHRGLHTLVGATAVCMAVVLLCRWLVSWRAPRSMNRFTIGRWVQGDLARLRSPIAVAVTVAVSALGHVLPDAIMHEDVRPFAPLTDANPLFAAMPLSSLHLGLVLACALGGVTMRAGWTRGRRHRAGERPGG